MNYERIYSELIFRAKNRTILEGNYKEKHHIIPRCMGGTDDEWNLVALFPEEHLFAHLLLTKIYPTNFGICQAAAMMSYAPEYYDRRVKSKEYAWLKKKINKLQSRPYEEKYGFEKANKIKTKLREHNSKPYEEKYGFEKANKIKTKISNSTKNENNPNKKEWILVSPNDRIYHITKNDSLEKFAISHNIDYSDLTSCAIKKQGHVKFWKCFIKDDFKFFNHDIWKNERKQLISKYPLGRIKVNYDKNKIKIFKHSSEVIDFFKINKHTYYNLLKNNTYRPKILKYRNIIEERNLKIEKVI